MWALCIIEDWDSSTNDKTRSSFRRLQELINGKLEWFSIIDSIEKLFPSFDEVRDATSKTSIIYRTFMAFNLARGGIDWAKNLRSTTEAQEDHHIFPKDWLSNNRHPNEDKQLWTSLRDSVLNRIFVSKKANSDAKAQIPPNYLIKLTAAERRVLQIPESFLGPLETPIKSEAFSAFLKDRYDIIQKDFVDYIRSNLK